MVNIDRKDIPLEFYFWPRWSLQAKFTFPLETIKIIPNKIYKTEISNRLDIK